MRSSMTKLRSTKKFEIVLDSNKLKWFYMSCAAALPQLDRGSDYESERHRFESYTPHHLRLKLPATGAFLLCRRCMDSNLGRGAGVKKTRSVFSPRASAPAGGRSRCGSAQRMRGIRLIGQNVCPRWGIGAGRCPFFSRLNSVPAFNRSDRMCVRLPIVPAGR